MQFPFNFNCPTAAVIFNIFIIKHLTTINGRVKANGYVVKK